MTMESDKFDTKELHAIDDRIFPERKLLKNHEPSEIDEETLRKLPYWKQWLYRTAKEIRAKQNSASY